MKPEHPFMKLIRDVAQQIESGNVQCIAVAMVNGPEIVSVAFSPQRPTPSMIGALEHLQFMVREAVFSENNKSTIIPAKTIM